MNTIRSAIASIAMVLTLIAVSNIVFSWPQQNAIAQQPEQPRVQTQEEENKTRSVILAFTKAFNDHNVTALDNVVDKNIVEHRPGVQSGINSTKQFLNGLITAFPDFHTTLEHILVKGNYIVVFTNTTGTHKGQFMFAPGIPPTGKHISFRTADLYRIENNKIAEHWDVVEYIKMLQDIGAIRFTNPMPSIPTTTPPSLPPPSTR
jgi:predicted ester cyclase